MPSRTRFSMTITMVHGKRPNRGQERGSQGGPNDFLLDACGCATPLGRMDFFYWGNHGKVQSPSKMVIEVRANRIKQEKWGCK